MAERDFEDSGDERRPSVAGDPFQDLKTRPRDTMPRDPTAGE